MLPARDSAEYANFSADDRAWLKRWLQWTHTNKELLRRTRTILGQPALGKVDGTAAIDRDHGFVFLFNPDPRRLSAHVALDAGIGLSAGRRFIVREVHPEEGRLLAKPAAGFFAMGDTLDVVLDGASALVLEIAPAPVRVAQPMLFGASGAARIDGAVLALDSVTGAMGTSARLVVVLPLRSSVTRATVNGTTAALVRGHGNVVSVDVNFSGARFSQLQPVIAWDSTFAGGRVAGTLTIPRRVFEQLRARRQSWPIPWTSDDYRTTWLVPERLLLWAPMNTSNDSLAVRLTIDDAPVAMTKAYTAVRVARGTFTGFYADISQLEPDRPYRITLELPPLARGQFLGLYIENVEPAYGPASVVSLK
jgi:hypothetical protein